MNNRITIIHWELPAYMSMALIGIFVVTVLGMIVVWKKRLSLTVFLQMELIGGIAALAGARLWCYFEFFCENIDQSSTIGKATGQGLSFYGAIFLGAPVIFLLSYILQIDFKIYVRNLICFIPLLHGFWKLGCYFGGCCYGVPYHGIGEVIYEKGTAAPCGVSLFPVQLLEALFLFGIALYLYFKGRTHEWVHPILEYMGIYAFGRFFIELLRNQNKVCILSFGQFASLLCILGIMLYIFLEQKMLKRRGIRN